MVAGVHNGTTAAGTNAHVALTDGLAQVDVIVVDVGNLAHNCGACLLYTSGVGLRCQKQGSTLVMNLGFSHQVNVPDTEVCTIVWQDPNHFSVTGIDKQKVGQYAAEIRAKKPPEPYKGKGIRYAGEVVKHKEGKAGKGKK